MVAFQSVEKPILRGKWRRKFGREYFILKRKFHWLFSSVNRTIPFACGATLAYNYIDLQFQNNTENDFQIKLWLDDEYLHGDLLCSAPTSHQYEIFETDHQFRQQPWGGYTRHNRIWKRITDLQNNQITEELVSENNAIMMYSPFLTGR